MKGKKWYLVALVVLLAALSACAPAVTPAPAPAPAAALPQPKAPSLTPEEAAWAQVVAAAKKEGSVIVYGSAFVADIGRRMSREFEKQYGVRLEVLAGGGNQLAEKVRVEQKIGKPIADIMGSSGGSIGQLVMDGLGVSTAKELPELRDKSVFITDPVLSPGGEILFYALDISPTVINTNLVKPQDEPKSWYDYLDPKWKGKIMTPDPRTTGGGSAFYYALRYFKAIDMDYISRLAKQDMIIWKGNNREGIKMVARGEYPSYLFGPMDGIAPLIAEGAPIKALAMKEGNTASGRGVTMVKNAPHPNAAKLFINWLLTVQGQTIFHEESRMAPFRKGLPDFSIPQARLPDAKVVTRTWEFELWMEKDMKAGTMVQVFGDK